MPQHGSTILTSLASFNYDDEIALAIVSQARTSLPFLSASLSSLSPLPTPPTTICTLFPYSSRALRASRAAYQALVLPPLETDILNLSTPLLPHPSIFLDYLPYVRRIVYADDAEEQAEIRATEATAAARGPIGTAIMTRLTRNSGGTGVGVPRYVRYLTKLDKETQAVRKSGFDFEGIEALLV